MWTIYLWDYDKLKSYNAPGGVKNDSRVYMYHCRIFFCLSVQQLLRPMQHFGNYIPLPLSPPVMGQIPPNLRMRYNSRYVSVDFTKIRSKGCSHTNEHCCAQRVHVVTASFHTIRRKGSKRQKGLIQPQIQR